MGLFGKKEKPTCSLCGSKTGLTNAAFTLDSGETICTKCVILLAGAFKADQDNLKAKSLDELQIMYQEKNNQEEAKQEAANSLLETFKPTKALSTILLVDEEHRLFSKFEKSPTTIYQLDSITGYELVENGTSVTSGGLGRAAVGGILFGGAGAIVGAVTGQKKTASLVNDLKIKLTTDNLDKPVLYFSLIDKPVKSDSAEYRGRIEAADEVLASLDILLK